MIKIIIFFVLILFSKNIFAKDYFYQCGNILYDSFYIKDNWFSKDEAFFKSYSKNYWLEAEEVKITKKEFLLKGVVLEEGTYITLVSPIIINIKYDREKKESKKILVDGEFLLKNGKKVKKNDTWDMHNCGPVTSAKSMSLNEFIRDIPCHKRTNEQIEEAKLHGTTCIK